MILAIDFDGTICKGTYPAIDDQQPFAAETIERLYNDGHYIIINTCRSGERLLEAINWMLHQGIKFHRVNDNHPEQIALYNNNSRKVYAHMYIDDKNLGGFPGWPVAYHLISEKELEWNKTASNKS